MADYIKREDVYKAIENAGEGNNGFLADEIDAIPSADVVEVKHARWVRGKYHVAMGITIPIIECSLCRAITPVTEVERWKYCIGCGARMDGGT